MAMTFMGWTASQWAEAKGYWNLCKQPETTKNSFGMRNVRAFWLRQWPRQPGEHLVVMAEHPMDFLWAFDALDVAIKETEIFPR